MSGLQFMVQALLAKIVFYTRSVREQQETVELKSRCCSASNMPSASSIGGLSACCLNCSPVSALCIDHPLPTFGAVTPVAARQLVQQQARAPCLLCAVIAYAMRCQAATSRFLMGVGPVSMWCISAAVEGSVLNDKSASNSGGSHMAFSTCPTVLLMYVLCRVIERTARSSMTWNDYLYTSTRALSLYTGMVLPLRSTHTATVCV
jgi:hypothetical protein